MYLIFGNTAEQPVTSPFDNVTENYQQISPCSQYTTTLCDSILQQIAELKQPILYIHVEIIHFVHYNR